MLEKYKIEKNDTEYNNRGIIIMINEYNPYDKTMNIKGSCPNCATTLIFIDAARFAKENDLASDDVVMCHNCRKAYVVGLTSNEMTFVNEIDTHNNNEKSMDNNQKHAVNNNYYDAPQDNDVQKGTGQIPTEIQNPIQQPYYPQPDMDVNNNQSIPIERSMIQILFYKKDRRTNEYRISKTKTITILSFLFVFIFINMYMIVYLSNTHGAANDYSNIYFFVVGSLIGALIVAGPVFMVGYFISLFLDNF